jgi:hypothetical protein
MQGPGEVARTGINNMAKPTSFSGKPKKSSSTSFDFGHNVKSKSKGGKSNGSKRNRSGGGS